MHLIYLFITLSISSEAHGERPNIINRNSSSDNSPQIKDDFLIGSDANFFNGSCGPNAYYYYNYSAHHLYISGTGPMADYQLGKTPWHCFHHIIRNITIDEGITAIGSFSFYHCYILPNFSLPASVTSIGAYAFARCDNLTKIYNGLCLNYLGEYAFYNSTNFVSLEPILNSTSIKPYTFYGTKSHISLTNSVTAIEDSAFEISKNVVISCTAKQSNIRTVKSRAFYSAQNIYIGNLLTNIQTIEPYSFGYISIASLNTTFLHLQSIPSYAFYGSRRIGSIVLEVATSISSYAFASSDLSSINIGSSLRSLELNAFPEAHPYFKGSGPSYSCIDGFLFQSTTLLLAPSSYNGNKTAIPTRTTAIADYAFSNCKFPDSNLVYTIPSGVRSIGSHAFYRFQGQYPYGENIKFCILGPASISDYAFGYCAASIIEIPSATSLGSYAFAHCEITSLQIPDTMRTIDSKAFGFCRITYFSIAGTSSYFTVRNNNLYTANGQTLLMYAYQYNTSYSVPNSIRTINSYAFQNSQLRSIIFEPTNYINLSPYLFYGLTNLASVSLPNCLSSIGEYFFYSCSNLRSITLPNSSLTTIGDFAFSRCSYLNSIVIPNTVRTIGHHAFSSCTYLSSITLPDTVTTIGDYAFFTV